MDKMDFFDTIDRMDVIQFIWTIVVIVLYGYCFGAVYMFYKDFIKPKITRKRR